MVVTLLLQPSVCRLPPDNLITLESFVFGNFLFIFHRQQHQLSITILRFRHRNTDRQSKGDKTQILSTMSNAKYTPAPQQDPDAVYAPPAAASPSHEFDQFSQAPPSYQDDEARLFAGEGAARSSEDNIPDDFKFGGSVAEATLDIRNQFVRKVYTILTAQLLVTGAVSTISFVSPAYKEWIQSHPALVFVSVCRVSSSPSLAVPCREPPPPL
jgi:hypothetical protein